MNALTGGRRRAMGFLFAMLSLTAGPGLSPADADYCWIYDDTEAYTKLACPGEPIPATQKVWERHKKWHDCFGAIGTASGPTFRGQRFIAFHRQIIQEFNLHRESLNKEKIETWDASQGLRLTLPYPDCQTGFDRNCDKNNDGDCTDPVDDAILCNTCQTLPACFTVNANNVVGCAPFGYTNLDQFKNADEIGIALDTPSGWHASFHVGLSEADHDPATPGAQTCNDANDTAATTGEPLFWRAHQKLDDVLTDWQVRNAVDVVIVMDRSGSMNDPSPLGGTKLDRAKEAATMFASLVRGATNGSTNRIGLVSFSSGATSDLGLTDSTAAISADGTSGPLVTAIGGLSATGSTSIGAGIETALCMLCPDSDSNGTCDSIDCEATGGNPRKAILLISDGMENTPPCLDGAAPPCAGEEIDYEGTDPYKSLGYTHICAIGYGEESVLDGDLLTRLTERQGGIYVAGEDEDDLKEFFAKCYGELTASLVGFDPKGTLARDALASDPVSYDTCTDSEVTFVLGWKKAVKGGVRLAVTSPSGGAVTLADPVIRSDRDATWEFARVPLPYRGETSGTWRARVVRPHRSFLNGFVTDAFADPAQGVELVRTQIQRLCPDGCARVLYYEEGPAKGESAYQYQATAESAYKAALEKETAAGTLGTVARAGGAADLEQRLREGAFDLLVYANQTQAGAQPFDALLTRTACGRERKMIVTDNRAPEVTGSLFRCLGAVRVNSTNRSRIVGDGRLALADVQLREREGTVWSYGFVAANDADTQASFEVRRTDHAEHSGHGHAFEERSAAVVATGTGGDPVEWFLNVHAVGLSRLDPVTPRSVYRTGGRLKPTVRITESFRPQGGYDNVVARVEVTKPAEGPGNRFVRTRLDKAAVTHGDPQTALAATLARLRRDRHKGDHTSPHAHPRTYLLYDDGTHGDSFPNNHYWSAELPDVADVEGNYRYRFMLDLTKDGCTQRREVAQTVYVGVGVSPLATGVVVRPDDRHPDRRRVTFTPRDTLGNYLGPGKPGVVACGPAGTCVCKAAEVVDHGNGSYTIPVTVAPGAVACRIDAFGTTFEPPLELEQCVRCEETVKSGYGRSVKE